MLITLIDVMKDLLNILSRKVVEKIVQAAHLLFPRDKNLWVFCPNRSMVDVDLDNVVTLFIESYKHNDNRRKVILVKTEQLLLSFRALGYESYLLDSREAIKIKWKAGVFFFDHNIINVTKWLYGGATKINLWHGVGPKTVAHLSYTGLSFLSKIRQYLLVLAEYAPTDYVVTTSPLMQTYSMKAWKLSKERCPVLGYSRMDWLHLTKEALIEEIEKWQEKSLYAQLVHSLGSFAKVILFAPTFRSKIPPIAFSSEEVLSLQLFLKEKGWLMIIKDHPFVKPHGINLNENILVLPNLIQAHLFLPWMDGLVTDYSSIYADYLIFDRPIIHFVADQKEYESQERPLFNFEKMKAGPVVCDFSSLLDCLERLDLNEWASIRAEARKNLFSHTNHLSSQTVYKFFSSTL